MSIKSHKGKASGSGKFPLVALEVGTLNDKDIVPQTLKKIKELQAQLRRAAHLTERLEKCGSEHANEPYAIRWLNSSENELFLVNTEMKRMASQNIYLHEHCDITPKNLFHRLALFATLADLFKTIVRKDLAIREQFRLLMTSKLHPAEIRAWDERKEWEAIFENESCEHSDPDRSEQSAVIVPKAISSGVLLRMDLIAEHNGVSKKLIDAFYDVESILKPQGVLIAEMESKIEKEEVESIWVNSKEMILGEYDAKERTDKENEGGCLAFVVENKITIILLLLLLMAIVVAIPMWIQFIRTYWRREKKLD